ncbi:DUF2062 domain-containing protein [Brevibacillus fulvus]|uniref:Uncharacterized protein (DUF2062 family) n=1 Tax=Brevibacillus fulvus TaxID=1125967 RepID=A0A938XW78_9BACL|nr:DUF2062 domain-containing protein [Brevibacillus fulvus]MBM7588845.1 uncharacterized protein (DUF2062 family) [Brevibacillus fulvus]
MNGQKTMIQRLYRSLKFYFVKLFRTPDSANKLAAGFAIGFGLEMLVISTASLIYLLLYPLVKCLRASMPAAIIGNVIGKLTFLPLLLLPLAKKIGALIIPEATNTSEGMLTALFNGGLQVLTGMLFFGLLLGLLSYYVVRILYNREIERRERKREKPKISLVQHKS